MRKNFRFGLLVSLFVVHIGVSQETQTKESQKAIIPLSALTELQNGNDRFVNGLMKKRDLLQQVEKTKDGQFPYAAIVSCIDSRTSVELTFDQGIGDVFNARIAGNIVNDDIIGSLEFATAIAGAKLIVVLGHSECGAIKGSCDNVRFGTLSTLLEKITPAVQSVDSSIHPRNSSNKEFVRQATEKNVLLTVENIQKRSPVLQSKIEKKEIGIIGGIYDVSTGKVQFLASTKGGF